MQRAAVRSVARGGARCTFQDIFELARRRVEEVVLRDLELLLVAHLLHLSR